MPIPLARLLSIRVPTIRHVPGLLRREVTSLLTACVRRYCDEPSDGNLTMLMAFPKLCLRAVTLKGKNKSAELEAVLASRLATFRSGDLCSLWKDLEGEQGVNLVRPRPWTRSMTAEMDTDARPEISDSLARLVARHVADGEPRKALNALMSHGLHDPEDPQVVEKLRALHPPCEEKLPPSLPKRLDGPMSGPEDVRAWEELVRSAILRFPRGTAPGPSGLRASHLYDCVQRRGGGAPLVSALAHLAQLWSSGGLPDGHEAIWCGATLIPLKKADGGVRPVAIGETLRSLLGKTLLSMPQALDEVRRLQPTQVGLGMSGAVEAAGIGLQTLVDHLGPQANWAVLQVDVSNAFNTVRRTSIMKGALARTPSLYNFLRYAY